MLLLLASALLRVTSPQSLRNRPGEAGGRCWALGGWWDGPGLSCGKALHGAWERSFAETRSLSENQPGRSQTPLHNPPAPAAGGTAWLR